MVKRSLIIFSAVAALGFGGTGISATPSSADGVYFGFSFGNPGYGVYDSYPAYPRYRAYGYEPYGYPVYPYAARPRGQVYGGYPVYPRYGAFAYGPPRYGVHPGYRAHGSYPKYYRGGYRHRRW